MSLKFLGSYDGLRRCVARTRFCGVWRELPNGQSQYRTDDGAILNWWESSGTITFQGRDDGTAFENAFIAEAKAKQGLIRKKVRHSPAPIARGTNVRRRIEQAQADIARLKWTALRDESPALKDIIAHKLGNAAKMINDLLD